MQRNFKNLLTSSVMAMSVAVSSISQAAGPKGGGPNLGSSSIQRSFSVNTNHQVLNQNTNVLHSTQTFKSINPVITNNTVKSGVLSNLGNNSLRQIHVNGNNGIPSVTGKTPVKVNVGNLQNLHLNQNSLHLNQQKLHLNGINNKLLIGNKGIYKLNNPSGPLFNTKLVKPFCSPVGNKFCSPCWKTFCTPSWWYNCYPCWYPFYNSCWSPFYPQFWSPCYSTCYSPCYSVGLPWLCSFGYYALAYSGYYPVQSVAVDVELVDVRQIDAGDVQQQLGPAYRVAFRNNSVVDINHAFSVGAMASTSRRLSKDFPMATIQVPGIKAGSTVAVDIRLPLDSQRMGVNYMGQNVPFAYLYVVVDSFNQLNDINRNNNSTFQGRLDIPMASN
jgi:hypothetical protein